MMAILVMQLEKFNNLGQTRSLLSDGKNKTVVHINHQESVVSLRTFVPGGVRHTMFFKSKKIS